MAAERSNKFVGYTKIALFGVVALILVGSIYFFANFDSKESTSKIKSVKPAKTVNTRKNVNPSKHANSSIENKKNVDLKEQINSENAVKLHPKQPITVQSTVEKPEIFVGLKAEEENESDETKFEEKNENALEKKEDSFDKANDKEDLTGNNFTQTKDETNEPEQPAESDYEFEDPKTIKNTNNDNNTNNNNDNPVSIDDKSKTRPVGEENPVSYDDSYEYLSANENNSECEDSENDSSNLRDKPKKEEEDLYCYKPPEDEKVEVEKSAHELSQEPDDRITDYLEDEDETIPEWFKFIKDNKIEVLKSFLQSTSESDLNEKTLKGLNALQYAALQLNYEAIKLLIECEKFKFDINETFIEEYNGTILHIIAEVSQKNPLVASDTIKLLQNKSPNLKIVNIDGMTPLLVASHRGQTEVVQALLDVGSDITDVDPKKKGNAIHWAMRSCKRSTIKLLIDRGVDIYHVNFANAEAIHQAAGLGCVDGLKELILTRRVDKNRLSPHSNGEKVSGLLYKATPLHFAASYFMFRPEECFEAVKFLMLIQSKVEVHDENGNLPIYYARYESRCVELYHYFKNRVTWECTTKMNGQSIEEDLRRTELSDESPEEKQAMYDIFYTHYTHDNQFKKN